MFNGGGLNPTNPPLRTPLPYRYGDFWIWK